MSLVEISPYGVRCLGGAPCGSDIQLDWRRAMTHIAPAHAHRSGEILSQRLPIVRSPTLGEMFAEAIWKAGVVEDEN